MAPFGRAQDAPRADLPELAVEGPEETAASLRRLEALDRTRLEGAMRLAGLAEPGPPIQVLLAPEGSSLARRAPAWVAGYATGPYGPVVLFPARAASYPYDSLEELVQHEVAHVLIDRAAGGRPVPRWFHEGVAMVAGEAWGLEDRTRFGLAMVRTGEYPLARIDRLFAGGGADAARGYAISGAFVGWLLRRHGPELTGEVLAGLRDGAEFDTAFRRAAGESLAAAEEAFWNRQTLWHRWVPLVTSSTVLWIAITLLALATIRRRRARTAALEARWAALDGSVPGGPPPQPEPPTTAPPDADPRAEPSRWDERVH
ncbi:MAG TPA: hypothetical protein VHQ65_16870 [Thermoanaerobaculia bacterium]|nr:hypothetical protein [Thermoanaerobaculia bacterium]